MGALLQEALAKMKGIPVNPPTLPSPKRLKKFPNNSQSISAVPVDSNPTDQLPITMPMPLPYTVKAAPIPMTGAAAKAIQFQNNAMVNAPVPSTDKWINNR